VMVVLIKMTNETIIKPLIIVLVLSISTSSLDTMIIEAFPDGKDFPLTLERMV